METPLETYRRVVSEQPACDAQFFSEALSRYRAGDEAAGRTISGSCLRLALAIAEDRSREAPSLPLFDVIQEANAGLMEAIATFSGGELQEFLAHARQRIERRIAVLT
jgi:DNA-directed RNA polymerase sigma subunit (sigma70/sigma32)